MDLHRPIIGRATGLSPHIRWTCSIRRLPRCGMGRVGSTMRIRLSSGSARRGLTNPTPDSAASNSSRRCSASIGPDQLPIGPVAPGETLKEHDCRPPSALRRRSRSSGANGSLAVTTTRLASSSFASSRYRRTLFRIARITTSESTQPPPVGGATRVLRPGTSIRTMNRYPATSWLSPGRRWDRSSQPLNEWEIFLACPLVGGLGGSLPPAGCTSSPTGTGILATRRTS
jgi:hypothetical protein